MVSTQVLIIVFILSLLPIVFAPHDVYAETITLSWTFGSEYDHTIDVGDEVCWTWDSSEHTITSGSSRVSDGKFDTGVMSIPGPAEFCHTFNEVGNFPYFCRPHVNMNGIVRVVENDTDVDVHEGPSTQLTVTTNPESIKSGDIVTYIYVETNDGTVPFTNVMLTDTSCTPEFIGGDDNSNNVLDPGESWTYQCTRSLYYQILPYVNIVTASVTDPNGNIITFTEDIDEISGAMIWVPGSECFVAKAILGSEMAYDVQILREVRDNVVLQTETGQQFMDTVHAYYYTFSPTISDWETENPFFKEFVKIAIAPALKTFLILNYVEIDSEFDIGFYITSIILLNLGMYFIGPIFIITRLSRSNF